MKRFFTMVLVVIMISVLAACAGKQEEKTTNTDIPSISYSEDANMENNNQSAGDEEESVDAVKDIVDSMENTVDFMEDTADSMENTVDSTEGMDDSEPAVQPTPETESIKTEENDEVRILVKKGERLLELWQGEALVGSYSIGLGFEPEGHKQAEGDGKTPEGEYYVCVRNSNSKFYLSLGVSYPNKEDAAAALADGRIDDAAYERIANAIDDGLRPDWYTALGGEIMIHGCGGSSDWTRGCIAVDNEVMDILFDYCPLGTKITIIP